MLSSSIQASLVGRYNSDYGISKKNAEDILFKYGLENNVKVYVFRFPNLFGKWCKPNYNSVVATFCNNIANDLPIQVNDENTVLELLYIDDLVNEMISLLLNKGNKCDYNGIDLIKNDAGKYYYVPCTYKVTLRELVEDLQGFSKFCKDFVISEIPENSFKKKLYSTYLSYLPKEKVCVPLKMNVDERGSFTELIKTINNGQFSVNVSRPGITKGNHWHNSKWELFIVVSGHGLIQERKLNSDEVIEFEVSGEKPEAIIMLPGYTHNIINLSKDKDLVTLMWANEQFDKANPDTFKEDI